jgi:hypothetical protein
MDWREQGWTGTQRTTKKHAEETTFIAERTVLTQWLAHLLLPLVARCIWLLLPLVAIASPTGLPTDCSQNTCASNIVNIIS